MAKGYPIVLLLENKRAIVIGGGSVAERKVRGLLECDALVTVVSPIITDGISNLVQQKKCRWLEKEYEACDLRLVDIVFAATDDESVNARVFADSTAARLMVNVADRPELCSFYLPSVLRRGELSIAVSTQGSSPLLARRIRLQLEERFTDIYATYVDLLSNARPRVKSCIPENRRMDFWDKATDGHMMDVLETEGVQAAETALDQLLATYCEE